jgi:hypothetical protein
VGITTEYVSKRGDLPQACPGRRRIYVVPQDDLKLFVRLYAAYQSAKGWKPPEIVDRLNAAYEALGVSTSDFSPIDRSYSASGTP